MHPLGRVFRWVTSMTRPIFSGMNKATKKNQFLVVRSNAHGLGAFIFKFTSNLMHKKIKWDFGHKLDRQLAPEYAFDQTMKCITVQVHMGGLSVS